jgi:hypothetical protein
MRLVYRVQFEPGRYLFRQNLVNPLIWDIGCTETGRFLAFAFTEDEAKHICLALNLVDAYIGGNTSDQSELLKALQKLRH